MLLLLLCRFSHVRLCPTIDSSHPWDSPGKNTGLGCHFLLQCMKVKSESEVAQSRLTLRDPMDCSLPGSSVHGIFQAGVLEWVAIAFSKTMVHRIAKSQTRLSNSHSLTHWWLDIHIHCKMIITIKLINTSIILLVYLFEGERRWEHLKFYSLSKLQYTI